MMAVNVNYNIKADFEKDWIEITKREMEYMGYLLPYSISDSEIPSLYFNALKRRIPLIPRKTYKAASFKCIPEFENGMKGLEDKIRKGEDLNVYLSRQLPNPKYNDMLLNDWGLHHFHLGEGINEQGMIEGTDPVLVALVTGDSFYIIDFVKHKPIKDWANKKFVEIIHQNWPEIIKHKRTKQSFSVDLADTVKHHELRSAHVNALITMDDGATYSLGGYFADGTSVSVRMMTDDAYMLVRFWEGRLRDNINVFAEELKAKGVILPIDLRFKLCMLNNTFWIRELNTGVLLTGLDFLITKLNS
jgi:hypothetical protein